MQRLTLETTLVEYNRDTSAQQPTLLLVDDIVWAAYITKENAELRDKELLR